MKQLLMLWCLLSSMAIAQQPIETFAWGDFGKTQIYMGGTQALELVLTDRQHQQQAEQLASQLSQTGKLAAVLNMDTYLSEIAARQAKCFDAATPLSVYAQDLQQNHQFTHFEPAFVTGLGRAGAYLFAMLSQVPAGLFRGAFSSDMQTQLPLPLAPCKNSPAVSWQPAQKAIQLNPFLAPATPWYLFNSPSQVQHWLNTVPLMNNWSQARDQAETQLSEKQRTDKNNLDQLPLVVLEGNSHGDLANADIMALVISGDGGWANIDKDIANNLSGRGVPVVGWNSLQYFWEGKDPQIAGADLQQVLDHYTGLWHKTKVLLIGFSMGADVMPFMVNSLNHQTRAKVLSVNLLNPSTSVDFTFHLSGWLNSSAEDPYKTYPEASQWRDWPTNCFYSDKDESLCAALEKLPTRQAQQINLFYLPGDHHFDGNYQQLVNLILTHSPITASSANRPDAQTTTQSPSAP